MPRTRKNHPPSLKAKVAIEAIKAQRTTAQIAQMFGVHPTQVGGWKRQALAGLPDVFGNGREQIRQQADLVLLCYKRNDPQKGHHGSCARRCRAMVMRRVVIDCGLCRSGRTRAARPEVRRKAGRW